QDRVAFEQRAAENCEIAIGRNQCTDHSIVRGGAGDRADMEVPSNPQQRIAVAMPQLCLSATATGQRRREA
ncbi:MAG: hypothetical protein KA132_01815, partial [Thauera sp.]|nr:hypothetical protein [Thauera sp.]